MATPPYDETVNNTICMALDNAGIFTQFISICDDFALKPSQPGAMLKTAALAEVFSRHIAPVRSISRFRVVQIGSENIKGWTWLGAIVVQHGSVLEIMFEGDNGSASAGSTLHGLRNTALRLRGAAGAGPPYLRPDYDGDDARLDRLAHAIADLVNAMKDVLRNEPLPL